tara:strand:- start:71 stop:457 length:387 start_codon:yes stop_codon:yes gene_type:complete
MKKLLLLFPLSFFISCSVYKNVSNITEKVERIKNSAEVISKSLRNASQEVYKVQIKLGMSKDEFLNVAAEKAKKDVIFTDSYVYKVNQYDLNGYKVDSMFYYFRSSDNKLFEINSGTKAGYIDVKNNN